MNKGTTSRSRRQYSSTLRDEQAEQTKERILAAVGELLGGGGLDDLSFASVAAQAGVSVPTVYRYFSSRKALFDGIEEWLAREMKAPPFPQDWKELANGSPELYRYYDQARDLFRAAVVSSLFGEAHQRNRKDRDRRLAKLISPLTEHLDKREANAIHALIRLLYGFEGFAFMNERFGATADEVSNVVAWAMRAFAAQIETDRAAATGRARKSQKAGGPTASRSTNNGDRGR